MDSFTLYLILLLALIHYMGDYILQTHMMAKSKSSSWKWLSAHVATYTAVLLITTGWPLFALVNGVLHFLTDAITSRITTKLWAQQKWHWFFTWLGADQLIHGVTFLATLYLLA